MQLTPNYYNPIENRSLSAWDRATLCASNEWCFTLGNSTDIATIAAKIADFLEYDYGLALIKQFPIEHDISLTKSLLIDFVSHLGKPLPQNESGDLVFSVEVKEGSTDTRFNRGPFNNESLGFHSDRTDVTALLCCVQAHVGGETKLVNSPRLHQELLLHYPDLLECLYQPFYYAKANWETHLADDYVYPLPVFTWQEGYFACRYLKPLIDKAYSVNQSITLSSKQIFALAKLEELANNDLFNIEIHLKPGDLLLLNNHTTLHARNRFVDNPGSKRLLLRAWVATSNSRPLHPYYLPLFGTCEAGSLRGGFR